MQPVPDVPEFRGTQAHQPGDRRNATNDRGIHPMIRAERSRVDGSGTDPANRCRALAHEIPAVAVFAAVLSADLVTKAWAEAALTEPVRIADWLGLMLRHNAGMFLGTVPVSTGYWICVCATAGWFGWRAIRSRRKSVAICLAVVVSGVIGNAIGQAQGAVVDFIGIGPIAGDKWLVANVADLALVAGTLALGCSLVRERVRRTYRPSGPGRDPAGGRREVPAEGAVRIGCATLKSADCLDRASSRSIARDDGRHG